MTRIEKRIQTADKRLKIAEKRTLILTKQLRKAVEKRDKAKRIWIESIEDNNGYYLEITNKFKGCSLTPGNKRRSS